MYRIGFPFWKFLARCGVTLKMRIHVAFDDEAEVFIATSPDLPGLFCEATTFPELKKELEWCINALLEHHLLSEYKYPVADMRFTNIAELQST